MNGKLSGKAHIGGSVSGGGVISGVVNGSAGGGSPPYSGNYSVVPSMDKDIILPTQNRVMTGNLHIEKIPQYEVSNQSGGETLIIGGTQNGNK